MTLSTAIFAFLGLAALIAAAGTVLTRAGDRIADLSNLMQGILLMLMLTFVLLTLAGPDVTL